MVAVNFFMIDILIDFFIVSAVKLIKSPGFG